MPENKTITFFTSRETMESDRAEHIARMDPIEGLRSTVELILRVYNTSREELSIRPRDRKMTIRQLS